MKNSPNRHFPLTVILLVAIGLFAPNRALSLTIFSGLDNGAGPSGPTPNSDAAHNAFLSNLVPGSVGIQDFDATATGSIPGSGIIIGFSGTSVTATVTPISNSEITAVNQFGAFPISSPNYLRTHDFTGGNDFLTITFNSPQSAFGFFATDAVDDLGISPLIPSIQVILDGGLPIDLTNEDPFTIAGGSVMFFGVIDAVNSFTTVLLRNPTGTLEDSFGLDDFVIGVIPEPATLSLLALGSLVTLRRKSELPKCETGR